MARTLQKAKFPDATQGPGLSKDSSLRPAMLTLSAQEGMGIYLKVTINNGEQSKYFVKLMIPGLRTVVTGK